MGERCKLFQSEEERAAGMPLLGGFKMHLAELPEERDDSPISHLDDHDHASSGCSTPVRAAPCIAFAYPARTHLSLCFFELHAIGSRRVRTGWLRSVGCGFRGCTLI